MDQCEKLAHFASSSKSRPRIVHEEDVSVVASSVSKKQGGPMIDPSRTGWPDTIVARCESTVRHKGATISCSA